MCFTICETRHSILLARRHKKDTSKDTSPSQPVAKRAIFSTKNLLNKSLKRPLTFFFTEATVQISALYNGYLYGLSFLFNSAFVIVFGPEGHGFNTIDTGLCFLGICVGITIGPIINAIFQEPYFQHKLKKEKYGSYAGKGCGDFVSNQLVLVCMDELCQHPLDCPGTC